MCLPGVAHHALSSARPSEPDPEPADMAAELFSTSLPQGQGEAEVKKSFIQLHQLDPPARNQDQGDARDGGGGQQEPGGADRDDRDWTEVQPTLRERSGGSGGSGGPGLGSSDAVVLGSGTL